MNGDLYLWEVVLQHDVQGYSQRFTVEAVDLPWAVSKAHQMLRARGYEDGAFSTISVSRKSRTRVLRSIPQR